MRIRPALASLLAVATFTGLAAAPASGAPAKKAPTPTCFGKHATKVLKANGKVLTGTKKNDVLIATGKNDTVLGLGGNDLICVTKAAKKVDAGAGNDKVQVVSGTVKGGDGNDTIVQKGSGKVSVDAGAGNDVVTITAGSAAGGPGNDKLTQARTGVVTLVGGPGADLLAVSANVQPGSTADGGADADALTVPSAVLGNVRIPVTSGDSLNGVTLSVDQPPSGGPAYGLSVNGKLPTGQPIDANTLQTDYGLGDNPSGVQVDVGNVAYAPGRDPGGYSIDWGDGTAPLTGNGPPAGPLGHTYLTPGVRTATVRVSDDRGATTTRTFQVSSTALLDQVFPSLGQTGIVGNTVTFKITANPAGRPITSWVVDFGDGSAELAGSDPPDGKTFMHTYPLAAHYVAQLQVQFGGQVYRAQTTSGVSLGATRALSAYLYGNSRIGDAARILSPGGSLVINNSSQGYDSYTFDPGDGRLPSTSTFISWAKPGSYTLKVIGHRNGVTPDDVLDIPVTVQAPPSRAVISAPSLAGEGSVTWSLGQSIVAPGATWSYQEPASPYGNVTGTGLLPASLTYLLPARHGNGGMSDEYPYDLSLDITNYPRPLTDTTTLEYDVETDATVTVVPQATHIDELLIGSHSSALRSGGGSVVVPIDVLTTSPPGVSVTSRTITIDGVPHTTSGRASAPDDLFSLGVGDHRIVATITDTAGRVARKVGLVSVAGPTTVSVPTTTVTVQVNHELTLTGIAEAVGANAKPLDWDIDTDSGPRTSGYGVLPSSFAHTFTTTGAHTIHVSAADDHFGVGSVTVNVTVTP